MSAEHRYVSGKVITHVTENERKLASLSRVPRDRENNQKPLMHLLNHISVNLPFVAEGKLKDGCL